jgi:hypothetical protein
VAPRATPPFEPELVPLVFEVCVSGERAVGAGAVTEPPVVPVLVVGGVGGTVLVLGTVLVPVGLVAVGAAGLVVVGAPVVVVPFAGVVVDGVVVDGPVVVVGLPAAGSVFRLSGSTTSEIGSEGRCVRVRVDVLVLDVELLDRALALI